MVAAVRKAAGATAPVIVGVNFGDLDMYHAGGGLPEGDYVIAEMNVQMYQAETQAGATRGPARLGVMVHLQSMAEPAAEYRTQFYSMGTSAHLSFAPNPATGKGLVPVAGGPAAGFNNSTNWAVFLKSMYDCGLPKGIFINDVSVLEGTHVHLAPTPPPKERAGFKSKTAEVQEEEKVRDIMVVNEIKDDGKPWEGTGGLLEGAPATPAATATASKANGAVRAAAPAAAAAAADTGGATEEDILMAASDGVTAVLAANPQGCTKLALRMGTFKAVTKAAGADMAQVVADTFFTSDAALNKVIGILGFKVVGADVKMA